MPAASSACPWPCCAEQLSMLREADMFHHWGPFINESAVLKEVNKMALVLRINIVVPVVMSR